MEENKINSNQITPKKLRKNNKEVVEIEIGRPNPAFNLISIKARYRFHQIKENFSKNEYNNYMRRCKNMYSISSKMSAEMKMSDIYESEKQNIDGILNIYHQLYDKISSKRIRLTKFKKAKPIILREKKSLSALNIIKEKLNDSKFRTINNFKNGNDNIKFQTLKINETRTNDKNLISTFSNNFKGNFSNNMINNKLKRKDFNKTINPSLNNANIISNKNLENIENIMNNKNIKKAGENKELFELKTKQSPKSGKSTGLTITNFGAIIYNNSIFRNKNISNFLHNNQVLPFIYSSKY